MSERLHNKSITIVLQLTYMSVRNICDTYWDVYRAHGQNEILSCYFGWEYGGDERDLKREGSLYIKVAEIYAVFML